MSQWLANTVEGYGRAFDEYSAVANMAPHIDTEYQDGDIEVEIVEYEGDIEFGTTGIFEGDGEILSRKVVVMDRGDLNRVGEMCYNLEIATEEVLVNGERIDE